jgi:hypothetical protein
MKYVATIYSDERIPENRSEEEYQAVNQAYIDLIGEMQQKGVMLGGEALQPTATATTVRVRGRERQVTDGPFAETKEQLGGFFLLECKDLDEAIDWAAKIPGAAEGCVEVRPVIVFDEAGNVVEEATA